MTSSSSSSLFTMPHCAYSSVNICRLKHWMFTGYQGVTSVPTTSCIPPTTCMYAFVYVCTCRAMHVCIHVRVYMWSHACVQLCMCTCRVMHVCIRVCVCTCGVMHMYIHVCVYVWSQICVHLCIVYMWHHASVHLCKCVYM